MTDNPRPAGRGAADTLAELTEALRQTRDGPLLKPEAQAEHLLALMPTTAEAAALAAALDRLPHWSRVERRSSGRWHVSLYSNEAQMRKHIWSDAKASDDLRDAIEWLLPAAAALAATGGEDGE